MNIVKTIASQSGIDFNEKISYGEVGYHIVKFAHDSKNKIDIIIKGSRGRGAAKEMIFGSTCHHVLHALKLPVLIVK